MWVIGKLLPGQELDLTSLAAHLCGCGCSQSGLGCRSDTQRPPAPLSIRFPTHATQERDSETSVLLRVSLRFLGPGDRKQPRVSPSRPLRGDSGPRRTGGSASTRTRCGGWVQPRGFGIGWHRSEYNHSGFKGSKETS